MSNNSSRAIVSSTTYEDGQDGTESDWQLPLTFADKRHTEPIEGETESSYPWRMKEKMKTVSVALVLCLNVGVDPPDIVKTQPCARLECWIDPLSMSPQKALETIGNNLQKQYERWQPRARYKQSLDPTVDEVKKLCQSLRRNAKDERVLFHYNGHGVPKPTANGEIWVFNRTYTQYIPLSIYDLQTWMGAPSIYVYDCSNAGAIVDLFKQFAEQHEKEYEQSLSARPNAGSPLPTPPPPSFANCIQLAACSLDQILPMNPDLPADIFTSCLTTPIKVALRWFVKQNSAKLVSKVSLESIDKIPGQLNDRRTMLGELNWIFTAITDTIAWNTLPRELFHKLFRQDLLVASLFRNFLLAERIMRSYDCSPVSSPKLPPTYQHPMWQAWDLAVDPALIQYNLNLFLFQAWDLAVDLALAQLPAVLEDESKFHHSPFFEEQLTAFQVWLDLGSEQRTPPEQLPIVLQVLLSQVHRLRALELLGRFVDLGPWAVNLALSVGIFPYVLKLLQSIAKELRPFLVFIWAKILAVDVSCQADLVRENGHKYFLSLIQDTSMPSDQRTLAAFVLSCIVHNHLPGQEVALQGSLVSVCLEQVNDKHHLLRQWLVICLARLWNNYDKARWCGVRDSAHEKLYALLKDPIPEVRAAAVYALGTFMNSVVERSEHANNIDHSVATMLLNTVSHDMCPLVRKELVVALQWIVIVFENKFLSVAVSELQRESQSSSSGRFMSSSGFTGPPLPPLGPGASSELSSASSPVNTLRRHASRDRIREVASAGRDLPDSTTDWKLKRVSSSSSLTSLNSSLVPTFTVSSAAAGNTFVSIYQKLWQGLSALDQDPHPEVCSMSHQVTDYIRDQVCAWPREEYAWKGSSSLSHITFAKESVPKEVSDTKISASLSLPPSPSNRSGYLTAESPPASLFGNSTLELNRIAISSPRYTPLTFKTRNTVPNTITEDGTLAEDSGSQRCPLVSTEFVSWSTKHFSQPVMTGCDAVDAESGFYYQREFRYLRNAQVRRDAREEQRRAYVSRLDHQVFSSRTSYVPTALILHPYEPHFVVAAKDGLSVWDHITDS
uniref:Regulatory-associated protein of mTOR n=1 Tax=Cacopsylla melanoneura TaxID=428564 RepID=A0A8D8TJF2_9HEMI